MKETKRYQKELFEELAKIKTDAELLPSMFRHEAVYRSECKKDKEIAEERMKVKNTVLKFQEALKKYGTLV